MTLKRPYFRQDQRQREQRNEKIAEAYRGGRSLTVVGRLYGLGPSTIGYTLKMMGVERRPRGFRLLTPEEQAAQRQRQKRKEERKEAERRERQQRKQTAQLQRQKRDEKIAEAYRSGGTCNEVGYAFGISKCAVLHALRKMGVERRSSKQSINDRLAKQRTPEEQAAFNLLQRRRRGMRSIWAAARNAIA